MALPLAPARRRPPAHRGYLARDLSGALARGGELSRRGEGRATWVFQIARRLSWRARNAATRQPETFGGNDAEERWDDAWPLRQESFEDAALDRVAFAEALRRLTPKHRETLELVFYAGFTLDETAAILSIPTGTVKSRISFARQALWNQLRARLRATPRKGAHSSDEPGRTTVKRATHLDWPELSGIEPEHLRARKGRHSRPLVALLAAAALVALSVVIFSIFGGPGRLNSLGADHGHATATPAPCAPDQYQVRR